MMLELALELLSMHNKFGETALHRAIRYGREKMFAFLDREAKKKYPNREEIFEKFYQRKDKSYNILHIAVSAEQFGEIPTHMNGSFYRILI